MARPQVSVSNLCASGDDQPNGAPPGSTTSQHLLHYRPLRRDNGLSQINRSDRAVTVWMVRAGKDGEQEEMALAKSVAVVGWPELPDMTPVSTRQDLRILLEASYPEEKPKTLANWESQLWPLRDTIQEGDIVMLPLKTRSDIAIGRVKGPYAYRADLPRGPFHTRPVDWLKELPRNAFDQDILYSPGISRGRRSDTPFADGRHVW